MRLIAGLGNPGEKYRRTRHNAGFMVVDELLARAPSAAKEYGGGPDAWAARIEIAGERVTVLKPLAFMNRSGPVIDAALRWFKLEATDLLVISDEVALPLGTIRVRPRGSHGGQNGLRSIIDSLGTDDFPRLRVGVGENPQEGPLGTAASAGVPGGEGSRDLAGYVLSDFRRDEVLRVQEVVAVAADAVETIVRSGVAEAMNRFNGAPTRPE
jgi:PTH1 family peptidyl-tRNA hydrolase